MSGCLRVRVSGCLGGACVRVWLYESVVYRWTRMRVSACACACVCVRMGLWVCESGSVWVRDACVGVGGRDGVVKI